MEKFFELAKPSSGFRMTQAQVDMLRHVQGWMGSAVAKLRHAITGTWFSDTQRPANHGHDECAGRSKGRFRRGGWWRAQRCDWRRRKK